MTKRTVTPEERALFETVARKTAPRAPDAAGAKSAKKAAPVDAGIDGNTAERLKRGELEPEARFDLHGLTEAQAHRALLTFIRGAVARNCKLVLVVTGRVRDEDGPFDLGLAGKPRGSLARMAPRWLKEPEFKPFIADVRHAHRKHGGAGALYVYLRRGSRL